MPTVRLGLLALLLAGLLFVRAAVAGSFFFERRRLEVAPEESGVALVASGFP